MAGKRKVQQYRKMKPIFIVFCEGETEENYLDFLRRTYRSPIKIIPKTEGSNISKKLIDKRVKEVRIAPNEEIKTFLMYDLDVKSVNDKLFECSAVQLFSNPCIEFWFLLHIKDYKSQISTNICITELKRSSPLWQQYDKSILSDPQKNHLWINKPAAIVRAKCLKELNNPSSSVYKLLEEIEKYNE